MDNKTKFKSLINYVHLISPHIVSYCSLSFIWFDVSRQGTLG